MKKTLFLSAILGAALCSSAFAETVTINGTQNNLNLNDAAYAGKDLILNLTGGYFYGNGVNSVFSQNIQVGDGSETQGGIIGNNGWGNLVTFSGTITGNGEIKKTGNGTNLKHAFTGDVTGYTGNITLGAGANFYLCFGAVNDGAAATSQNSTATAGVSGTGDITFTSDKNDLVYKYAASAGTVYITNAIKKDGGTAKVQLLGGGSYSFEKDVTIDTLTLGDNSVILLADSSKRSSLGSIQGTGTLKYTGSTQWAFGRNNMAATVTLEGVMAEDGVTSNVKYNANYGVNAGIIKNVNIENLDAGHVNGSITMDGAYGSMKLGGTQRNITLTGEGLHLTAAGSPQTDKNSYTFNVLAGDGKFVKAFEADQNITIVDATAWTGTYSNTADNSKVIFSGNTNASMEGGTVQLGGTAYAGDHISDAVVSVTSTEAVTISNKLTNVTLNATGKDVTLSGEVNGGTLTGVTMGNQTIKGNVILDAVTLTNQLSLDNGASLTLQNGVTDNGSSTFAFIVGGTGKTGTLTFAAGSYDLTNHGTGIAVYTGSTMTVQSGAAVDVKSVYFSSTLENNGDVTVNNGGTLNLTGGTSNIGVLTANGAVTVAGNLSTNAQLAVGGTYTQTGNKATVKTYLDLADNATVTLGNGSMEVQGTDGAQGIWFHSGSHIDLTGTGKLTADGMVISKGTGESSIKSTESVAQIGSSDDSGAYNAALTFTNTNVEVTGNVLRAYTFEGGKVTVNSNTETTIKSALSDTTNVTVNTGSAAIFNAEGTTAAAVDVNGDLTVKAASTVKQLGGLGTVKALADLTVTEAEYGKVSLGGMEIAGNTTVTVNDHAGTLTLGSLTVTGSGSTINANLDLSGATVTLNGNSVELGCDLKFDGTAITLSDDDIAAISGAGLLLFSDVESLTLGTTTHNTDYIGLVDASGIILTLAGDATSALPDKVFVNFSATDKTVSLSVVPEPATATLSLLALAALAARRRRH